MIDEMCLCLYQLSGSESAVSVMPSSAATCNFPAAAVKVPSSCPEKPGIIAYHM